MSGLFLIQAKTCSLKIFLGLDLVMGSLNFKTCPLDGAWIILHIHVTSHIFVNSRFCDFTYLHFTVNYVNSRISHWSGLCELTYLFSNYLCEFT